MDSVKLLSIFILIMLLIHFRMPLWGAVLAASLQTAVLFRIPAPIFLHRALKTISSPSCLELLFITYGLILLQYIMEKNTMLSGAKDCINDLCNNKKLSLAFSPIAVGILPSPGSVLIAGTMVRQTSEGKLDNHTMAFITTYYRHIPEALFPIYTNVILICTISRTPAWLFLIWMLPYTLFNMLVPYLIYLQPVRFGKWEVRKDINPIQVSGKLLQNMWPILSIIFMTLVLRLNTALSVLITLVILFLRSIPPARETASLLKKAVDGNMLLMVMMILVFTDMLSLTNAPGSLLDSLEGMPVPSVLVYGIIVFLGAIVSNFTAMIPTVIPAALATCSAPLSMVIYLASMGHLASQLCPTHICLSLCANQFNTSLNRIFSRTVPVAIIMGFVTYGLYVIMLSLAL